jgi:hypothetical protein
MVQAKENAEEIPDPTNCGLAGILEIPQGRIRHCEERFECYWRHQARKI